MWGEDHVAGFFLILRPKGEGGREIIMLREKGKGEDRKLTRCGILGGLLSRNWKISLHWLRGCG
jgi:hypothetical protein